jgi:hypothetical protein
MKRVSHSWVIAVGWLVAAPPGLAAAERRPNDKGFDEAFYLPGWGVTSVADVWDNDVFDDRYRRNGTLVPTAGSATDVLFDAAMAWMNETAAAGAPFLCYLPTTAPHGPCRVPDKDKAPYRGKGPSAFFGMIANIDENVGRLERLSAASGLRENTILIFAHDNGGTGGVNLYNAGMRGRETTYYEGGHRAACFVRRPGRTAPAILPHPPDHHRPRRRRRPARLPAGRGHRPRPVVRGVRTRLAPAVGRRLLAGRGESGPVRPVGGARRRGGVLDLRHDRVGWCRWPRRAPTPGGRCRGRCSAPPP